MLNRLVACCLLLLVCPATQAFAPQPYPHETTHKLSPPHLSRRAHTPLQRRPGVLLDDDGSVMIGRMHMAMPENAPAGAEDPTLLRTKYFIRSLEGDEHLVFIDTGAHDLGQTRVFGMVQAAIGHGATDAVPILGTFALAEVEGEASLHHLRYQATQAPDISLKPDIDISRANFVARQDGLTFAKKTALGPPEGILAVQYIDDAPKLVYLVHILTEAPHAKWAYSVDAHDGRILSRVIAHQDSVAGILRAQVEPMCQGDATQATPLPFMQWTAGFATNADGKFYSPQPLSSARVAIRGVYFYTKSYNGDAAATYPLQPQPAYNELLFDAAPLSQIDPYVYASQARAWVVARAATMPPIATRQRFQSWTSLQFPIKVNLPSGYQGFSCNAFYDGVALNFYEGDAQRGCNNSGRAKKIVYHEYGHGVHDRLTGSRYTFNPQVSEGIADYVMATMTGDSRVTGLFGCQQTLPGRSTMRDCQNRYTYCNSRRCNSFPGDEPHNSAPIICGALWEVRAAMRGQYGNDQGTLKADQLFLRFLTLVTDMSSAYAAAIAADEDDDNNPANGTRHSCIINRAFIGNKDGDFAHFPDAARLRVPCREGQ